MLYLNILSLVSIRLLGGHFTHIIVGIIEVIFGYWVPNLRRKCQDCKDPFRQSRAKYFIFRRT